MLTGPDLQELRGIAFDRLLLQVWPKPPPATSDGPCVSCGQSPAPARGLCMRCYGRWRSGRVNDYGLPINPLPAAPGDQCDESLMAKRIGVSRVTMRHWRDGTQTPKLRTMRSAAPKLEAEFGIPATLWLEATYISNCARGWVLNTSKQEFIRNYDHPPVSTRRRMAAEGLVGRQFGYWFVLEITESRRYGLWPGAQMYLFAKVKCLLCGETGERCLKEIKGGSSTKCKSCARRLCDYPGTRHSQYRGVQHRKTRGGQYYWGVGGYGTDALPRRAFAGDLDAARYYDACMYERYGHTLFLNFPDEYDRSNDPAFVPVSRPAAGAASPEPAASAPTRRSPLPAGGTAQHRL